MSSRNVCQHCGCSDIDIDANRGDVVCTNCGSVLEENAIVSDIQFEENSHGGYNVIGQFVGPDGRGKLSVPGFQLGFGNESREVTLQNAHKNLKNLGHLLKLNQHCIDTAFNFFKMALSRRLTCGRKSSHVIASCLYMTSRIEGTSHLLIDFSDALQIDVYELGHTFLRLATALCISIPTVDPCLYILRFAHKLQFGKKTQEVAMTALKLVQRMKRDWIHAGRRPSGLCGAALLIAARLHDFRRDVQDIVHIVRVHESTLRKRLIEFGETPSSSLTFNEFMNIDLEEEQDPPSFKTARKRDKINKLLEQEEVAIEFTILQQEIQRILEHRKKKIDSFQKNANVLQAVQEVISIEFGNESEKLRAEKFVNEQTLDTISECIQQTVKTSGLQLPLIKSKADDRDEYQGTFSTDNFNQKNDEVPGLDGQLDLTGIDDQEIDSYIMSNKEIERKTKLWMKLNEEFLKEQEDKLKRKLEELSDEKPIKKRRNRGKKVPQLPANSVTEAIAKMLQEKRISSKINYDVLKSLSALNEMSVSDQSDNQQLKNRNICFNKNLNTDKDVCLEQQLQEEEEEEEIEIGDNLSAVQLLSEHLNQQKEHYTINDF